MGVPSNFGIGRLTPAFVAWHLGGGLIVVWRVSMALEFRAPTWPRRIAGEAGKSWASVQARACLGAVCKPLAPSWMDATCHAGSAHGKVVPSVAECAVYLW
jgi:hypothetical protein